MNSNLLSVYLKALDFRISFSSRSANLPLVFIIMSLSINARYLLLLALLHLSLVAAAPVDNVPRTPDSDTVLEGNTPFGIGETYHTHKARSRPGAAFAAPASSVVVHAHRKRAPDGF